MAEQYNPKKLGFMRFIQVLFTINTVFTIGFLAFISVGNITLNFSQIFELINLLFDGVSLWLIWRRKKAARNFIIAFSLFNIVIGTLYAIISGTFSPLNQLISCSFDIVLVLYFIFSHRAKALLVEPLSMKCEADELPHGETNFYRPKTWPFWRNIIIYFCVFSVVGHWMEAGYCTLIRFGLIPGTYDPNSLIWTEWLYPFCVYGFGAAACILLLYPIKNFLQKKISIPGIPLLLSFIMNALVCSAIELTMGLLLNQPLADGSMPLWDYRDMFCNFMGQICLQNAVAFGFVATLMTWVIYPGLEKLISRVPRDIMNIVFIVTIILFAVLFFLYCVDILIPGTSDLVDILNAPDDVGFDNLT